MYPLEVKMSIELVHVYRGNQVESIHRGDIVGVHKDGRIAFEYGSADKRTFWRSSAKPFQVIPFIESGGLERFNITQDELALMTSSHGGEARHVDLLSQILSKMNLTIDDLDCGVARPMYGGEYKRLLQEHIPFTQGNNPCSGKHSGMLGLGLIKNIDLENYIDKDHPIQVIMLAIVSEMTELPKASIDISIDGCGVPVFGLPIYNMALAFTKLDVSETDDLTPLRRDTLQTITKAMTGSPYYVAGTGRLDTILMEETDGKILAKLGAESVYCLTVLGEDISIAMKTEDGAYRALDCVIPDLLLKYDYINEEQHKNIQARLNLNVYNHRKQVVGSLRSVNL